MTPGRMRVEIVGDGTLRLSVLPGADVEVYFGERQELQPGDHITFPARVSPATYRVGDLPTTPRENLTQVRGILAKWRDVEFGSGMAMTLAMQFFRELEAALPEDDR